MENMINAPANLSLRRIKTSSELDGFPDLTRFLLVYNNGRSVHITHLEWNVSRTKRFLVIEGNGVMVSLYDDAQLQTEALYLLPF